jgi:hypothetical protein
MEEGVELFVSGKSVAGSSLRAAKNITKKHCIPEELLLVLPAN